jgi:predicted dehydrogenase
MIKMRFTYAYKKIYTIKYTEGDKMNKIKLGVIGVSGHFLERIMLPLSKSETVEVVALASRNIKKAEKAAADWDVKKAYGSYEAILSDNEVEAVYIPLPNHLHLEWIKKSIDAGKHVICEKPLTLTDDETLELIEYSKDKEPIVMEAFMYGFHPKWQMVKELLKVSGIGQVKSIHTIFSYTNNDPKNIRNIKEYGGGALMDIGCYAISSARFILDEEPLKVMALNSYSESFGTDTLASGIMAFENARALFTVSTDQYPAQEVKVYGTGGVLDIVIPFNDYYDMPGQIKVTNAMGTRTIEFEPTNQYGEMFNAFAAAIRAGKKSPISLENSYMNMHIISQLKKSGESGLWEIIQKL